MRQILYISQSTLPGDTADLAAILQQSRHNNAIDGVTGLLWSDGSCFLQVFEGPRTSMHATFARIQADTRHHHLRVVHDCPIENRDFSDWTMAYRRSSDPMDGHDVQVRRLLHDASQPIAQQFLGLIADGMTHA